MRSSCGNAGDRKRVRWGRTNDEYLKHFNCHQFYCVDVSWRILRIVRRKCFASRKQQVAWPLFGVLPPRTQSILMWHWYQPPRLLVPFSPRCLNHLRTRSKSSRRKPWTCSPSSGRAAIVASSSTVSASLKSLKCGETETIYFTVIWISWPLFGIRLPWEIFEGHLLPFITFYVYKSLIQREIGRAWIPDYAVRVVRYYLGRSVSRIMFSEFSWRCCIIEGHLRKEGQRYLGETLSTAL